MRIVFGIVSLLIVLAIVASLAKRQLHAVQDAGARVGASAPADPNATPAQQAHNIEQQFKDATNRALQQGVDRAASDSP